MRTVVEAAASMLVLLLLTSGLCQAQCTVNSTGCGSGIPHLVKFNGVVNGIPTNGSGVVPVKFTIYTDSTGGTPLWQEVQNAQVDAQGRYEVLLGVTATEGLPADLFASGDPRWLGVQVMLPGSDEQPRVLLVSVPYAMEAANAQTLGGLPASAFARAAPATTSLPSSSTVVANSSPSPVAAATDAAVAVSSAPTSSIEGRTGPVNVIPKYSGGGFTNSQITDASGAVSMQNLANILFADRYSGGVPDAVAACPANGCIIYALSPNVNLNLGTIDPGTKAITIYLGPYTFKVNQITLRKGLKIIGMGASGGAVGTGTCSVALPCNGTALQSSSGSVPVFVLPQISNTPATNVLLQGFRLYGAPGNTNQDGILLDTSTTVNNGLWYSRIDDVFISNFNGIGVHVKGRNADFLSTSQWVLFDHLVVFRNQGGGNGLRLEGASFELRFRNCQIDGSAAGDGTNIYLGGISGGVGGYPITIVFEGLISQTAATAVQVNGAINITFYGSHHEKVWGVYDVIDNMGIGTHGLTIADSYFAGDVATNGGAGYELKVETPLAFGINFARNQMFGQPDATVLSTNLATVAYQDNYYDGTLSLPPTNGITTQITAATTINTHGVHSVGLNPSATPITTIQSTLGPGETVTLYTLSGTATLAPGGNINLMGQTSLTIDGTVTLVRTDLGGPFWVVVSQWTPTLPPPPPTPMIQNSTRPRARPVPRVSQ
jgi:hypothetical protein